MEQAIGIIIGGVVALITLAVIFLLAGSAIIGAITALLTIPIAAPITSITRYFDSFSGLLCVSE